jgi:hypothetical protein
LDLDYRHPQLISRALPLNGSHTFYRKGTDYVTTIRQSGTPDPLVNPISYRATLVIPEQSIIEQLEPFYDGAKPNLSAVKILQIDCHHVDHFNGSLPGDNGSIATLKYDPELKAFAHSAWYGTYQGSLPIPGIRTKVESVPTKAKVRVDWFVDPNGYSCLVDQAAKGERLVLSPEHLVC